MKRNYFFTVLFIFVISACSSNDEQPDQYTHVRVIDENGGGIASATVVVANQAGQIGAVSSTDNNGYAYFDFALPDSTVTAALSCYYTPSDRTYYMMNVVYGVNVPEVVLTLGNCEEYTQQIDINTTAVVPGVIDGDVTLGPISYGPISYGETGRETMDVYELQDDGNISVFATGYDNAGDVIGYGFALDQPAIDGSVINVAIDRTDLDQYTHVFRNAPEDIISYYYSASLIRKHADTNLPINFNWGMAPLPAAITTYSTSSYADNNMLGVSVNVDQDGDGNGDADIGFTRYLQDPSGQVFDFSSAPAIPDNLVFDPRIDGRAQISWQDNDPGATVQEIMMTHTANSPQRVYFSYRMTVPASTHTVLFPELPDSLAAFRPVTYSNLSLQTMKFDRPVSYDRFLEDFAYYNGRFYEEEELNSYSFASISRVP